MAGAGWEDVGKTAPHGPVREILGNLWFPANPQSFPADWVQSVQPFPKFPRNHPNHGRVSRRENPGFGLILKRTVGSTLHTERIPTDNFWVTEKFHGSGRHYI